ncbi:MAG TPA: cupin domain-containing protein [Terracidiphilus sp.]
MTTSKGLIGRLIVVALIAMGMAFTASAQRTANWPLADRIGHPDLTKSKWGHSHGAAGLNRCAPLIDASKMDVNIYFILRCEAQPGGGPAEHFHNTVEEMFTIIDGGEGDFTVDSHTSRIKGPGGAPQRMGHAHGMVNHSNETYQYINFDVSYTKGHYDAFNLGDSRFNDVTLDPIPQFMFMHLDKALLKPEQNYHGGQGTVQYRRALDSDVFLTNWAYMDHEVIPPGASDGLHRHAGVEEVYFVMDGSGSFQLNDETAPIKKWDAIPVRFNEAHSITNNGTGDLELLIMGVAAQKNVLDTELGKMPQRGGGGM